MGRQRKDGSVALYQQNGVIGREDHDGNCASTVTASCLDGLDASIRAACSSSGDQEVPATARTGDPRPWDRPLKRRVHQTLGRTFVHRLWAKV